jgi:hypothetical protein
VVLYLGGWVKDEQLLTIKIWLVMNYAGTQNWWALVNMLIDLQIPYKVGNF